MPKQKIVKSTQNNSEINLELYTELLEDLKNRVATSRYKAIHMVNNELILLYHHIGSEIIRRQESHGWGSKIIDKLSKDLSASFPEMKGFGTSNLIICDVLPKILVIANLSSRLLDNYHGFI